MGVYLATLRMCEADQRARSRLQDEKVHVV